MHLVAFEKKYGRKKTRLGEGISYLVHFFKPESSFIFVYVGILSKGSVIGCLLSLALKQF